MGCTQSKGSEYGRHFAPSDKTIPIYHGYRKRDLDRARQYVETGGSQFIATGRPGDFHDYRKPKEVAYFTYSKDYARECARSGGTMVRIDLPREFYHQYRMFKFDDFPAEEWYQLVEANRRQVDLPRGRMNDIRNYDLIEGPIADTSTQTFTKTTGRLPPARFKPARYNNDPDAEYYQQLAVSGEALARINRLKRRFTP